MTPTSEEFLIAARRIIEEVERLTERTRASAAGEVGRLLVSFYKSLSAGSFRAALRDFREHHSNIEVEFVEVPFVELMAGLLSERIDVAVVLGDAGKCENLESVTLWAERLVVALPEDHPLSKKSDLYWPELKGARFLISHHDPSPDIRHVVLRHLAAPSDHPKILARHLCRESILSEVADG